MDKISGQPLRVSMWQMLDKDLFERGINVFYNYDYMGVDCGRCAIFVLFQAYLQSKLAEVLEMLEKHYDDYLSFQRPGAIDDVSDTDPTQQMFIQICDDVLQLQPNPA